MKSTLPATEVVVFVEVERNEEVPFSCSRMDQIWYTVTESSTLATLKAVTKTATGGLCAEVDAIKCIFTSSSLKRPITERKTAGLPLRTDSITAVSPYMSVDVNWRLIWGNVAGTSGLGLNAPNRKITWYPRVMAGL